MGGSPPRYGGIAGIPLCSALLPVLPVPSQGLMVGSVGGGGGRASYGEEPPRSSASAPQQGLGVVSRGAAGTAGAFHPLLRARSPLPPPYLPPPLLPAGPHSILSSKPHIWPSAPRGCSAAALRLSPQRGFSFCRAAHWER